MGARFRGVRVVLRAACLNVGRHGPWAVTCGVPNRPDSDIGLRPCDQRDPLRASKLSIW